VRNIKLDYYIFVEELTEKIINNIANLKKRKLRIKIIILGKNPLIISKFAKKEKIRIAYFSPDFKSHPVSLLTSELFEIHNRDKFEVFAFSLQQAPVGDETNIRLRKGFDKFLDVENISDKQIAKLARELEIDIAIDLAGPTQQSKTRIFSRWGWCFKTDSFPFRSKK
jgi:predicted O-linked N-acetylglucosamine transferase (SPINDLY family)